MRIASFSFEEAVTVFYDPLSAAFEDADHSDSEQRFIIPRLNPQLRWGELKKLCYSI